VFDAADGAVRDTLNGVSLQDLADETKKHRKGQAYIILFSRYGYEKTMGVSPRFPAALLIGAAARCTSRLRVHFGLGANGTVYALGGLSLLSAYGLNGKLHKRLLHIPPSPRFPALSFVLGARCNWTARFPSHCRTQSQCLASGRFPSCCCASCS
jgi:hypothetical protein